MGPPDYYAILGVSPDAEPSEIIHAYRRLARRYHPDAGAEGDRARFSEISHAYEVLRDPTARARYDARRGPVIRHRRPHSGRRASDVPRFIDPEPVRAPVWEPVDRGAWGSVDRGVWEPAHRAVWGQPGGGRRPGWGAPGPLAALISALFGDPPR